MDTFFLAKITRINAPLGGQDVRAEAVGSSLIPTQIPSSVWYQVEFPDLQIWRDGNMVDLEQWRTAQERLRAWAKTLSGPQRACFRVKCAQGSMDFVIE